MLRRIGATFLALLVVRGLAVVGPLLVMPFLVKTIGLEKWGMVSFALAATAFCGPIVQYGFSVSATAEIARAGSRRAQLRGIWRMNFVTSLWLALLTLVASFLGITFANVDNELRVLLYGALVLSVATALTPIWLFMGQEKMSSVIRSSAITRLGYLLLVFALVRGPEDTKLVLVLGAAASAAGLAASLFDVRRVLGLPIYLKASFKQILVTLRHGFPTFLMMFVPLLYNAGSVVILGISTSKENVGIFTVASTLVEAAIIAGRLAANASLPILASDSTNRNLLFGATMVIGLLFGTILVTMSDILAEWLTPDYAEEAGWVILLLALSIPFAFAQLTFNQNFLAIEGHAALGGGIVVICSLLGGILAYLLVPATGPIGAAAVVLACRFFLGSASYVGYRLVRVKSAERYMRSQNPKENSVE